MEATVLSRRDLIAMLATGGVVAGVRRPFGRRLANGPGIARAPNRSPSGELDALLQELVAKHRVPGALVGLYRNGEVTAAAAGIANLNTAIPFTVDTAFLTGSITKVW